jgi:hypothetical protein
MSASGGFGTKGTQKKAVPNGHRLFYTMASRSAVIFVSTHAREAE